MTGMTTVQHSRALIGILALLALVLAGAGCNAQPARWSELGETSQDEAAAQQQTHAKGLHVVPRPGRYVTQLRASDVIKILQSIGCSREQVLEIGTDFREALATRGAAEIMVGRKSQATIQVANGKVLISSLTRGMFEYNLRRGEIGLPPLQPGRPMPSAADQQ